MELIHQSGEIIAQRYRIIKTLGQGGVGITYAALDLQNRQPVALKALSLRRMIDWKKIELFEREARTLSQLNHPAIPRYFDYFQIDTSQDRRFYIAQQVAPGKSLAALVENGWEPNEAQVRHIATKVLEVLVYLQSLIPSIIHRDIKPQNIILQKNGQVFLVDFGAVQDTYHHTINGGSTVVGTYGYMAPEQFRGQAVLSTDLYGLGTTLLFLLTQKFPADLPRYKLKISFRSHVCISQDFADWLEKTIEPGIEERFHSAKEALAALRGEVLITNPDKMFRRSKHSQITLIRAERWLLLEIPPVWLPSSKRSFFGLLTRICQILLPVFCLSPILGLHPIVIGISRLFGYIPDEWLVTVFSKFLMLSGIGFLSFYAAIGLGKLAYFLFRATSRTRLEIDRENFLLQQWLLGWYYYKSGGCTQNNTGAELDRIYLPLTKKYLTVCTLQSKLHKYRFGLFLPLSEKEWLVGELKNFLENLPTVSTQKVLK